MLKNYAFISKQMKQMTEPMSEITMVHGNQKAIVSKEYTEIWDLDKETDHPHRYPQEDLQRDNFCRHAQDDSGDAGEDGAVAAAVEG
jgi:hypothetical protein